MMQANLEDDVHKLIAEMKISLDQKVEGPEGYADWVDAWSIASGQRGYS